MSYLPAIEELRTEIAETRKSLGEKEFVLAKLISWHEGKKEKVTGVIDSQEPLTLPVVPDAPRTLIGELRKVIQMLGDQEFQVQQLEQLLKGAGYIVAGKYPRARISSELATLVKNGEIVKSFEGTGSVPHRYRSATEVAKG